MANDFPVDFYVTCATVIPVLFLALVVEGRAIDSVVLASERAEIAHRQDLAQRLRGARSRRARAKVYLLASFG